MNHMREHLRGLVRELTRRQIIHTPTYSTLIPGTINTSTTAGLTPDKFVHIPRTPNFTPNCPMPPCPPVIFEDDDVLVFDKPGNLLVHPVGAEFTWGLINIARATYPSSDTLHLAHRVDRETSGVVVVARNDATNRCLKAAFRDRVVHKSYLAIVRGRVDFEHKLVDAAVEPDPDSPIRMKMRVAPRAPCSVVGAAPCPKAGKPALAAQTRVRLVAHWGGLSLLECQPLTGRKHQLRVHLDHLGFPLLGDKIYGQPPEVFLSLWEKRPLPDLAQRLGHPRHCLHAHRLAIDRGAGQAPWSFESPLPADMRAVLEAARAKAVL